MKLYTKIIIGFVIFMLIATMIYFFSKKIDSNSVVIVNDQEMIPEKACNEIKDEILVIIKTGCPACAKAEPILKEIEEEKNLKFIYINTAIEEQRSELIKLGFVPEGVPAFIVNCKVHLGALSKEKYLELLGW